MYLKLIINSYFVSRLDINKNRNLTVPLWTGFVDKLVGVLKRKMAVVFLSRLVNLNAQAQWPAYSSEVLLQVLGIRILSDFSRIFHR